MPPAVVTRRAISMYPTEKNVNETVASQKAAGTEIPTPRPDSGSLNIIAARGAEPVTMQNKTWGSPRAFRASSVEPVISRPAPGTGALVASMQPPFGLIPSGPHAFETRLMPQRNELGGVVSRPFGACASTRRTAI